MRAAETRTLVGAAEAIRTGEVTSVELTESCLRRIEVWQPRINCFTAVHADAARRDAERADAERAAGRIRGPLHGVPLAYKDIFLRPGYPMTVGTSVLAAETRATRTTATVIARLEAAGAVLLGSLNLSEWVGYSTGENPTFGDNRNPWNPNHITGGSSAGSASSVAARLVYGSLASDTGGSGRTPAALCNVVGLKPTYGRASRFGAFPRAWSLDTMSVMSRTAEDAARLLGVIAGRDENDPQTSTLPVPDYEAESAFLPAGTRIGVAGGIYRDGVTAEVEAALAAAIDVLRDAGVLIKTVDLPDPRPFFALADTIMKCEAAAIQGRRMREQPESFSKPVFSRLETGRHISASRYIEALALRPRLTEDFISAAFSDTDLLFIPAVAVPAPTLDSVKEGEITRVVNGLTKFFRPFNYPGLPAIIVPCGFSADGLPLAFQLVARPFGEARLIAAARAFQARTDWHEREPSAP